MSVRRLSIGRPSDDPVEHCARIERKAFQVLVTSLNELADVPLHDEIGLARARREYVRVKGFWAEALKAVDRSTH